MVRCLPVVPLLFLFFLGTEGFAQTVTDTLRANDSGIEFFDASQISNETFLRTSEDIFGDELQFLTDDIERIASRPILLGTASWNDLRLIPTLTDHDIFRMLKNRRDGNISNTDIPLESRSFIAASSAASHKYISIRSRVVLDPDAYKETVYESGAYHGSPVKTVSRITAKNDEILFSFVEAKDPGEPLYFDHLTGCFAITHPLSITKDVSISKCVLGDYSLSFGNGLLCTGGYSQLPGHDVDLNVEPRSNGIQPYISSSSFRFFRGAAVELTSGIISVSGFFSDRKIDATTDSNTITSLSFTGYHRTASELGRKDKAESKLAGGHIAITPLNEDNYLEFGATGYALGYDKPVIVKDPLSLGFRGRRHSMISAETRGAFSFISWDGEMAHMNSDAGKTNGFAMSVITAPLKILDVSLNYRDLPANFISPFGGTFGINSADAQNETGWYIGSKLTVIEKSLWLFGSVNFSISENPGKSNVHYSDIRFGSTYSLPSYPLHLTAELRSYGKGPAFTLTSDSLSKTSLRFDFDARISKRVHLSLRTEFQRSFSETDSEEKKGYLIGTALKYLPVEELSVATGIMFFGTDSYAARFYSNETDLPGSAPFVALYGNGYRYYVQCSYSPVNAIKISGRIVETLYAPAPGSAQLHKTTVGLQCDIAF